MNRCRFLRITAAGALALAAFAGPAQAQQGHRLFSEGVQRGTLEVLNPPMVRLNGKPIRVSPASRMRNQDNRIVLLSNFVGQKMVVNYRLDNMGQLGDIWLLTSAERAQVLPGEQSRMKAANEGVKYDGPVFQPGKPLHEQHQFRNPH